MKQTLLLAFLALLPLSQARANPDQKTSTATVQIHPPESGTVSERFLPNQIVILTAPNTLQEAAKTTGLDLKTLTDLIKVSPIKGTDIVTIHATHSEKGKAQAIVQAVIDAYSGQRSARSSNDLNAQLQAIDEAIQIQSDLVQDKRKDLTVIIQQYGIPYHEGQKGNSLAKTEQEMFASARKKLAAFETQRDQLEIQIKKFVETSNEDLIQYAAGLELPENQVTHYFKKYREALFDVETKIGTGLAQSHPEVIALQKKAQTALTFAEKEAATLKSVLRTKLELVNRQVERIRESVPDGRGEIIEPVLHQQVFSEAKQEYEASRTTLRELKIKQQEARLKARMPRKTVTIHGWSQ